MSWVERAIRKWTGVQSPSREILLACEEDYQQAAREVAGASGQGSQEDGGVGQGSCQNCSIAEIAKRGGVMDAVSQDGLWRCAECKRMLSYPHDVLMPTSIAGASMRDDDNLKREETLEDRDEKHEIAAESRALDAINEERYWVEGDDGRVTVYNTWVEVGRKFSRVDFAVKIADGGPLFKDLSYFKGVFENMGGTVVETDGFILGWWGLSENAPGTPGWPGEGVG